MLHRLEEKQEGKILPHLVGVDDACFTADGEYNFDAMERSILTPSVAGFGNPDSKLTEHEQFLLWKRMIQEDLFESRDAFCNSMAEYSSFEQAQQHLDSLCLARRG